MGKLKVFAFSIFALLVIFIGLDGLKFENNANAQGAEIFMGAPNAKITMIEYGSFACPHCSAFQKEVFPQLKTNYIDKGLVKFYFRPFPTQPASLSIGMQVLVDCAQNDKKFPLIDSFFENQIEIFQAAQGPNGALNTILEIAQRDGNIPNQRAIACLRDERMSQNILAISEDATARYNITGTPALVINGALHEHPPTEGHTYANVSAKLNQTLTALNRAPKAKPKPSSKNKAKKK